jgi:hypothetical protein
MKNTLTISCVFAFVFFMILPAYAIEHQLGGDLRFRAFTAGYWSGEKDNTSGDRALADSRAHFKYAAKINEDLAVYTKFRVDSDWGADDDPGRSGSSYAKLRFMVSYIDFNLGETNFKIGKQDFFEARGNLLYDAAPGISITSPLSEQFTFNAKWIKFGEGKPDEDKTKHVHDDLDTFAITPTIKLNNNISIKPYFWYVTSNEVGPAERTWNWQFMERTDGGDQDENLDIRKFSEMDMYYLGFDFDANLGDISIWFTALYQAGSANLAERLRADLAFGSVDFSGIAALGGGSVNLGKITLSGQLFYASGDSDLYDDKYEQFIPAEAGYYYWSEIMGLGSNDDDIPNNLNWALNNIMGGGGTASFCATEDMTVKFGLWYAAAIEDFIGARTGQLVEAADYGTEVNAMMDYNLMENLSLSFIGAYVMAGDAITEENVDGSNIEGADPYFVQAQIKASF